MTNKYNSVFDIPIKSVDGEENFLNKFRGKVLMFVNTTGHCGNAPQWPIIEEIKKEVNSNKFEVIYVPTNDYCGSVTYGDYKHGISSGKESQKYAYETYGVESPFTELVSSRNTFWEEKNLEFDYDINDWDRESDIGLFKDKKQAPRSELYDFLSPDEKDWVGGNFHKFLTNSKGVPVALFHNGTLLPFAREKGQKSVLSPEEEKRNMIDIIKNVIEKDECHIDRYKYPTIN